jgi:hypothetical protein
MVNTYSAYIGFGGGGPYPGYNSKHFVRTITADAFGTLTTPAGTFSNVLRIKTYEVTIDSAFPNNHFFHASFDSTLSYTWVQNDYNLFLMQINMNGAGTTAVSASYLKSYTNDILSLIIIFPNPCSYSFVIKPEIQLSNAHYIINDINGSVLLNQPLNDITSVDTHLLNEGVYFVSVISNEGVVKQKMIIVH